MPKGLAIDLDALHRILYRRADRQGRLKLHQGKLAEEIGVTKFTMSRLVSRLVDQKRIRLLTGNKNNRGQFVIEDPEVWKVLNDR